MSAPMQSLSAKQLPLALFGLAAAVLAAGAAAAAQVQIQVTGVSQARGHVRVELCTRETWLTYACPYVGAAPAVIGATWVQVDAPPGEYAAQAFLDDTDSGKVHQNFLGIPREPVGFSNDAPIRMRGPRFEDAVFVVPLGFTRIHLRLRHIFSR
jgi:uncharacterized protein (DUF2141 family)